MATLVEYEREETAKIIVYTKSLSGNLVDIASEPTITIVDPRGVKVVDGDSFTWFATGSYRYLYTTVKNSVLGKYHATATCVDGSNTVIKKDDFMVTGTYGE